MYSTFFLSRPLKAACVSLAIAVCACASAQTFPIKPLRIIVPFPAGGAQDILARTLADGLSTRLKQPVIVENRSGAAGNIGAEALAKASPDGYTLGILSGVHSANAAFYRKLPYSFERDFVPVSAIGDSAVVIVASNQSPFKTVGEMLAYGKANPGKINFGSTTSLTMDLLKVQTGVDVTMITYKGLGEALQDLMGGRIELGAGPSPQLIPLIKEGKIRALGLASRKRIAELPGVATVAETIEGYDAGMWYGLFAPVGTPAALVSRIAHETAQVLSSKSTREKLLTQGIDPDFSVASPQVIGDRIQTEIARWRRVAAATGNYAN